MKVTIKLYTNFIGYKNITKEINLNKNIRLNISLDSDAILTEEITITGEKLDKNVSSSDMSQAKIEVQNISKQLPVILGEVDVLKSAQLLPGNPIWW